MTFAVLFLIYLALVAGIAVCIAWRWLTGGARLATIALLAVWLAYAGLLGSTGVVARYHQLPPRHRNTYFADRSDAAGVDARAAWKRPCKADPAANYCWDFRSSASASNLAFITCGAFI